MKLWTLLMVIGEAIINKKHSLDIDEKLIERIGKQDKEAFNEFYRVTEKIVYSYILSITKDHHLSHDLMQETYMKILRSAHLYQPMGKPMAWVFTIAKRLSYSHFRSVKNEADYSIDDFTNTTDYASKPDDGHTMEMVDIALEILSEEERQIVLLSAISGLKHREIAASLDLKLSTVLSKYNRALKKMRLHLEQEGY